MTNSWFEDRPWITTLGDLAQEPYVLPESTPLADLAATVEARGDEEGINYYGFTLTWAEFDRYRQRCRLPLGPRHQARRPCRHL